MHTLSLADTSKIVDGLYYFVDYGHYGQVKSLAAIPQELCVLPALAIRCTTGYENMAKNMAQILKVGGRTERSFKAVAKVSAAYLVRASASNFANRQYLKMVLAS